MTDYTEARRDIVVVDLETTGLHNQAVPVEVAAINLDTGEELYFVPFLPREALADAEPKAMQINRYYERALFEQQLSPQKTRDGYEKLRDMLRGNVFAGSNPTFDSRLVANAEVRTGNTHYGTWYGKMGAVWHHRLGDIAAYAAGKLDIDLSDLPGVDAVLKLLNITGYDRHTARGDAQATAAAINVLREMNREVSL